MAGEAATGTTKQVFVDGLLRDITVSPDRRRIEVQSPQTNNGHLVLSTNVTEDGCNISVSGMQAKSMFGIPPDECTVTNYMLKNTICGMLQSLILSGQNEVVRASVRALQDELRCSSSQ